MRLMLLALFMMLPFYAMSQKVSVTGEITDESGEPIIGATVMEKGTTNGTMSDIDGKFTISVKPSSILSITYVGYVSQQIPVKGATDLKIILKEDNQLLDEVVVVGYGTMKKSDMTGAISTMTGEDLAKRATTNATSQQGVRDQIRHERMIEFPLENWRWYDMRRWGITAEALSAACRAGYEASRVFYPVPLTELNSNDQIVK